MICTALCLYLFRHFIKCNYFFVLCIIEAIKIATALQSYRDDVMGKTTIVSYLFIALCLYVYIRSGIHCQLNMFLPFIDLPMCHCSYQQYHVVLRFINVNFTRETLRASREPARPQRTERHLPKERLQQKEIP